MNRIAFLLAMTLSPIIASAATATATPTATATATATASLSNFNFQVISGTTPNFDVDFFYNIYNPSFYASTYASIPDGSDSQSISKLPVDYTFDLSASVQDSKNNAFADNAYNPGDTNSGLYTSAISTSGGVDAEANAGISFYYEANTLLKISADVNMTAASLYSGSSPYLTFTETYAKLSFGTDSSKHNGEQISQSETIKILQNGSFADTLSLFYFSDKSTFLTLSAQLKSTAVTPIAVVPEPETYALMFAGLGLVGFSARRRQLK